MTGQETGRGARRPGLALATLLAWVGITVFAARLGSTGEIRLQDVASRGVAWQVLAAGLMLVAVIARQRWRDLGFRAPARGTLKLLWQPAVMLAVLGSVALSLGLPPTGTILMVLLNSMLVGFSEETMFRGVLYRALAGPLRNWSAILLTTLAFGAVHVLNGFLTGNFLASALQAVAASCTGLVFIALVLRTGSLWVAILYHGLWDWLTFLMVLGAAALNEAQGLETPQDQGLFAQVLLPFALVLPNFLYGLWLLRGVKRAAPSGPGATA